MQNQSKLENVNPISGFGVFICCVGLIWTLMSVFTVMGNLNTLQSKTKLSPIALFVPVWGIIMVYQMVVAQNDLIDERRLNVEKVNPFLVLFLGSYYFNYAFFKAHNDVIAALQA